MEAAARRAGALGDTTARDQLTLGLMQSIAKEPYRPLRDFAYERTLTRTEAGELANTATAKEVLYGDKPPYAQWLQDNKIKLVWYADNDGSLRSDCVRFFAGQNFKRTDNPDGSTTMTAPEIAGKPAFEVVVKPAPKEGEQAAIFEHMAAPDVDVILYSGHAGYGKRVDHALASGVKGTGDGKLVVLHDGTVDRTTDGKGPVEALTLPEVKRLDAGSWFDARWAGERIPTLEEALMTPRFLGDAHPASADPVAVAA